MKKILVITALLLQVCSGAVTPTHSYNFATGLDDSSGSLHITGSGGTVSGGRYQFDANQGLTLAAGLGDVNTYTIEMVFTLDVLLPFYTKLIDFSNLELDEGLYGFGDSLGNVLHFYNDIGTGTDAFVAGAEYALVLTREADGKRRSIWMVFCNFLR